RHRAALSAIFVAKGPFGIILSLKIAVLVRVRINNAPKGAMLGGDLWLDAAPGAAVTGEDNLSPHVDSLPGERLVILGHAVVHIDQIARHIAVDGVSIIDGQHLFGL